MNKFSLYVILIPCFIFTSELITNFKINGNTKTQDSIILSQIEHPLYVPFNPKIGAQDQLNIYNLDIFSFVQIGYIDSTYHILVQEKSDFSIQPLIKNNDAVGRGGGAKIIFNNIRGLSNQIETGITFGDVKHIYIQYKNSVLHNKKTFYSLITSYEQNQNIIDNYNGKYSNIQFSYNFKKIKSIISLFIGNEYNSLKYDSQYRESYNFISTGMNYKRAKQDGNKFIRINFNFTEYISLKRHNDYQKISFQYNYSKKINNKSDASTLIIHSQLTINPKKISPIYEINYLGGDNLVRSYETDPLLNDNEVADKLKFKNFIFNSIQFEIPLFIKKSFRTSMLFFIDQAIGSNTYNSYDTSNRITGYGFGYSIEMAKNIRFDLCVGINDYGQRNYHFIVKPSV